MGANSRLASIVVAGGALISLAGVLQASPFPVSGPTDYEAAARGRWLMVAGLVFFVAALALTSGTDRRIVAGLMAGPAAVATAIAYAAGPSNLFPLLILPPALLIGAAMLIGRRGSAP